MNEELELYKLLTSEKTYEFGWISEKEFIVLVFFSYLEEFVSGLKNIFGDSLFNYGELQANIHKEFVCINLSKAIGEYIENVFPRDGSAAKFERL